MTAGRRRQKHKPDWSTEELAIVDALDTPEKIQGFLDEVAYNDVEEYRSPRLVMRDRRAHCFEGALFASAVLEHHGWGCRILDMHAVRDDDHIIALFQQHGCWGAVAKSNFTTLQFREPVYRTLRELVMSFFDVYFNTAGDKSLRSYSRSVDLRRFDHLGWRTTEEDLDPTIGEHLVAARHTPILTRAMERSLRRVGRRLFDAAMLGANPKGLFDAGGYDH